jgi:hypothetical protein
VKHLWRFRKRKKQFLFFPNRNNMKRFALFLLSSYAIAQNLSASDGINAGDVSYSPFKIHSSSKGDKGVIWTGSIASALAPVVLIGTVSGPVGMLISGILASAVLIYATRNNVNADQMYKQVWGKIEIQVNGAINAKAAAQMKDRLNTLSHNVHDQSIAYLSLMGITNTKDFATAPPPLITAHQVDIMMQPFDDILSASNGWYSTTPVDPKNPDAFVLASSGSSGKRCLHTRDFNLDAGTVLVVDSECKMSSVSDKMFAVEDGTERLLMRTERGVMCAAYSDRKGTNRNKPLAIFSIFSRQCVEGRKILLKRNKDGGFSIYEKGQDKMLCLGTGLMKKNKNVIVSTERRRTCVDNDFLTFQTKVPIALGSGSLTPAYSFDELGVQLFYFPHFATYHLAALKEMYLFGTNKRGAKVQFENKVEDYKLFLKRYLPIFEAYNSYVGLGAEDQIESVKVFQGILDEATINHKPQQFQGFA